MLTRAFQVQIEADNEKDARKLVEFFIGNPKDESTEKDRHQYKFNIREIEMTMNEAFEAEEVEE
jgi:hypothetical protein